VTVRLRSGDELTAESDARTPAADGELQFEWEVLCRKFTDLVESVLGAETAAEIVSRVGGLEHERDVRGLVVLTRRPAVAG
jgi:hypothetical protein